LTLRDYCAGLLTAEGRKSVEPIATATAQVSVQHQKLLHFVGEGDWSDQSVLAKVRELVIPAIERHGPIKAWIIDDTSYPKQAPIRSACTISIAANSASGPIVRWR
jgi:SRSO17 transposase